MDNTEITYYAGGGAGIHGAEVMRDETGRPVKWRKMKANNPTSAWYDFGNATPGKLQGLGVDIDLCDALEAAYNAPAPLFPFDAPAPLFPFDAPAPEPTQAPETTQAPLFPSEIFGYPCAPDPHADNTVCAGPKPNNVPEDSMEEITVPNRALAYVVAVLAMHGIQPNDDNTVANNGGSAAFGPHPTEPHAAVIKTPGPGKPPTVREGDNLGALLRALNVENTEVSDPLDVLGAGAEEKTSDGGVCYRYGSALRVKAIPTEDGAGAFRWTPTGGRGRWKEYAPADFHRLAYYANL